MTRSRVGMIASLASAALSVWWWRRRTRRTDAAHAGFDRGEVIFRNTPQSTDL